MVPLNPFMHSATTGSAIALYTCSCVTSGLKHSSSGVLNVRASETMPAPCFSLNEGRAGRGAVSAGSAGSSGCTSG